MKVKELTIGIGPTISCENFQNLKTHITMVVENPTEEDIKAVIPMVERFYWKALAMEAKILSSVEDVRGDFADLKDFIKIKVSGGTPVGKETTTRTRR